MAVVKVLIAEKDGVELAEDTEYQLTTTDIPEGAAKYYTDALVAASPQVVANTSTLATHTSNIATNTAAIATKAADSVVVKTVNGKSPTSGSVTLSAADIAFTPVSGQSSATTVQAAIVEAKAVLVVTADPSVSPGLAASLGTLAYKQTSPVGFWQKKGTLDTDWSGVAYGAGGGTGVTPPFEWSRANLAAGSYLNNGSIASNLAGRLVPGSNTLVKMSLSTTTVQTSALTVKLQRRTAVATFVDITNAVITIPAGSYSVVTTGYTVAVGVDWEISAICSVGNAGSSSGTLLTVYFVPA